MRFVLPLLLFGLCHLCGGCALILQTPPGREPVPAAELDRAIPPQGLRADLDHLIRVCDAVHPDLFAATSREQTSDRVASLGVSLDRPMTRLEFYPVVAALAASFSDPHTYVNSPNEEWTRFTNAGGKILPLDVNCSPAGTVLNRAYVEGSQLLPGDILDSINGVPAARLLAEALARTAGRDAYRYSIASRSFRRTVWLAGLAAPFAISARRPATGRQITEALDGLPAAELLKNMNAAQAPPPQDYCFVRLEDEIGYVDFRRMANSENFDEFLKSTFSAIRDRPIVGLIVDLRHNGGGDSRLGEALLNYITDKPYRMAARKEWKVSHEIRAQLKRHVAAWIRWMPLEMFLETGRKLWLTPVGQVAVFASGTTTPDANPLRFRGPVCFLIGAGTFSSAMMLADAVAECDLATLIGEETGGEPNAFGEVYSFDLPNSRLTVGVSSARYIGASGEGDRTGGVRPDVEILAASRPGQADADSVLDAARAWIRRAAK
jgi:Peptidase family S41